MASRPDGLIDLTTDDPSLLVAAVAELAPTGRGWVNVRPLVEEEDLPPPPGLASVFSAKGPPLPVGTWVPAPAGRGGPKGPATVGVQHPAGAKVARRLVEAGLRPPSTWRGRQDNPRRGLVVEVPADEDPAVVVDWLLRVMLELSPLPLAGEWRAEIYRG